MGEIPTRQESFQPVAIGTHVEVTKQNVGKYKKVAQEGRTATYMLVWSDYVPDAENEPTHPGEIQIPNESFGDWCDPATGKCSNLEQGTDCSAKLREMMAIEIPEGDGAKYMWVILGK